MTKESAPTFDARYDPAFQRGFTGATATRIHAVAPPRPDRAERPFAPRREPARPHAAEPRASDVYDPFAVPSARIAADDEASATEPGTQPAERSRGTGITVRGNPWVATLWVVAVLLLTSGFFGTWRAMSVYTGASPMTETYEIVTLQVLQVLSPSVLLAGLIVLAGLLFLYAASWRARTEEPSDP